MLNKSLLKHFTVWIKNIRELQKFQKSTAFICWCYLSKMPQAGGLNVRNLFSRCSGN